MRQTMVVWRRGWVLAGVALAALLAAASLGTAAGAKPPRATAVGVSESEFRIAVYRASLPPGLASFNVSNAGEDAHDLVVRRADGRTVTRMGELRAGERAVVRARLTPGTYRLVCTLADHASRGMRATIRVKRPER